MQKGSTDLITITLTEEAGDRKVTVAPDEIHVRRGQRVRLQVSGGDRVRGLLSVEVHQPGNRERSLMYSQTLGIPCRTDRVYVKGGEASIYVGKNAQTGSHPFKVYAHFSGSTITVEGSTTKSSDPRMIVE
jgi:hypothetical protein